MVSAQAPGLWRGGRGVAACSLLGPHSCCPGDPTVPGVVPVVPGQGRRCGTAPSSGPTPVSGCQHHHRDTAPRHRDVAPQAATAAQRRGEPREELHAMRDRSCARSGAPRETVAAQGAGDRARPRRCGAGGPPVAVAPAPLAACSPGPLPGLSGFPHPSFPSSLASRPNEKQMCGRRGRGPAGAAVPGGGRGAPGAARAGEGGRGGQEAGGPGDPVGGQRRGGSGGEGLAEARPRGGQSRRAEPSRAVRRRAGRDGAATGRAMHS